MESVIVILLFGVVIGSLGLALQKSKASTKGRRQNPHGQA
jgi:type II secretory pathway pseudopilin PulG